MPRPALREERVVEVCERAANAGLDLYRSKDLTAVSMRAVAGKLGLSGMALYRYFPEGKSGLIAQMRVLVFREFAVVLSSAVSSRRTARCNVKHMMRGAANFAIEHPDDYQLMFSFTQDCDHDSESPVHKARQSCWKPLHAVFREIQHEYNVALEPDEYGHLFVAATHGLIAFHLSGQPYPERRLTQLDLLLDLLFEGLVVKSGERINKE